MIFQVGLENHNEGRSIAWALEHPGCFAHGTSANAALASLDGALEKYAAWILRHEAHTWLSFSRDEIEFVVNSTWDVYYINDAMEKTTEMDGYSVESFFPYEWKPLSAVEIEHAIKILTWSRDDLLKIVQGLTSEKLDLTYMNERWSIRGILGHVGGAEWWYLERLGLAFPKNEIPKDPFERLEKIRSFFTNTLPKLEGSKQVLGVDGEFWSPRKMLRRALWHEKDHIEHIRKLV